MPEVWTDPFVATTNEIISSADANAGYRGNLLYLRQFLSANPAGAGLPLVSTGANGAGWSKVDTDGIADDAIEQAQIADNAVGTSQLATNAVTQAKIGDNAVGTAELVGGGVGNRVFATLDGTNVVLTQILTALIDDLQVTSGKLADGAVTAAKVGLTSVAATKLLASGTGNRVAATTDGTNVTYAQVSTAMIEADAIDSTLIAANAVGSSEIAANAVGSSELADGAVATTAKLADGIVTSAKIADGTITDGDVAAANKDGATGTASMRTLGTGAQQAAAGNHAHDSTYLKLAQGGSSQDITCTSATIRIGENAGDLIGASGVDGIAVAGGLVASGTKTRLATGRDGQRALLHALESPAPHFEDWGHGRLVGGHADVQIPPDFANYVALDDYHVFVCAEGPALLYVADRTAERFTVRALAGDLAAPFSWRLVAKQVDYADEPRLRGHA